MAEPGLAVVAADVHELIEALGFDGVAVLGVSGGGPYALALAALGSERTGSVAVHAGPGQFFEPAASGKAGARRAFARLADGDLVGATRTLFEGLDLECDPLRAGPGLGLRRRCPCRGSAGTDLAR